TSSPGGSAVNNGRRSFPSRERGRARFRHIQPHGLLRRAFCLYLNRRVNNLGTAFGTFGWPPEQQKPMSGTLTIVSSALLIPLAVLITYYDARYRRIPNPFVLATLIGGLAINAIANGLDGAGTSLLGCLLAFGLMFMLHLFGAMGAGDVKLFAAIGAVVGAPLVLKTFVVVILVGGVLAFVTMFRAGAVMMTMQRVLMLFVGLLPGWEMPRFAVPPDRRHTIPYGVAITLGSLISIALFRA
ncbi:MAG: A24 family peptidase, partial [Pyrinomonadaceae bacterium]